jgi:hypothetical protein
MKPELFRKAEEEEEWEEEEWEEEEDFEEEEWEEEGGGVLATPVSLPHPFYGCRGLST